MFKKGDSDLPLEPSPKEPLSGPFRPPLSPDACAYMPNDSARTTCWLKAGRNGPGFGKNGLGFGGEGRYPENVFTEKGACLLVCNLDATTAAAPYGRKMLPPRGSLIKIVHSSHGLQTRVENKH